ncbi:MAG: hypothetical protein JWP20_76 [Roseomonas sp.]|nr:hypothetical protein [Roseomonas sp.]
MTAADETTPIPSAPASVPPETQSSSQDGFSRFDENARKVASEAAGDMADKSDAYMHQGMANLNRAGSAVAGAIAQRPFSALMIAAVCGAMVAVARRA